MTRDALLKELKRQLQLSVYENTFVEQTRIYEYGKIDTVLFLIEELFIYHEVLANFPAPDMPTLQELTKENSK